MRPRREERRQKVLDELLELDPGARRGRIDQAVAAGDVHRDEVDSALRLVARLDALRVFTIQPHGEQPDPAAPLDDGHRGTNGETASSGELVASASGARRPANSPRLKPLAVPVGSDPERARRWLASGAMSMDALEAASRLVARDRAARTTSAAPLPPRRRRSRTALIESTARPLAEPTPIRGEPAAEGSRDESWPSIAWLRP